MVSTEKIADYIPAKFNCLKLKVCPDLLDCCAVPLCCVQQIATLQQGCNTPTLLQTGSMRVQMRKRSGW